MGDRDILLEIQQDIKEIKTMQAEHAKILAVNTHIVNQHEQRSTSLERQVSLMEKKHYAGGVFKDALHWAATLTLAALNVYHLFVK